jgi:hypothetical protein
VLCPNFRGTKFHVLTPIPELAGRQDDFCIICGEHAEELFPQIGPGEIHHCSRQLCNRCWHIEAGWKRNSLGRRNHRNEVTEGKAVVCCPLCWKRGWDYSSPLLGIDQPEWSGRETVMEDTLNRRHRNWENAAKTKIFAWRKPLLTHKDDMTIAADRELLQGMLKPFQKNPKRFKLFDPSEVVEATCNDTVFNIDDASSAHLQFLLDSSDLESDGEVDKKVAVEVKRGPGRPKRKSRPPGWYMVEEPIEPLETSPTAGIVDKSATPDTGGRPKRQAARLSFASGIPVQRTTTTSKDEEDDETPAPRRLKSRVSKIVVLPVSLPASPETKKHAANPSTPATRRISSFSSHSQLDLTMELAAGEEAGDPSEVAAAEPPQNGGRERPQSEVAEKAQMETSPEAPPSLLRNGLGTNPALPLEHNPDHVDDRSGHDIVSQNLIPNNNTAHAASNERSDETNTQLLELQKKHAALQENHTLLDVKYRRWRIGAVENSKLLFEQEEDLAAQKAIVSDINKAVKQLSSDNARLGAELALARGMVQYNPGLLKQTLLRSSLTPDVVERLFSNPDFIELLQPRPANGEVILAQPLPLPLPLPNPDSARPKKRRRITAADAVNDADAEEARQKKLTRVIAPTIKRLEKSRFKLSAADVETVFDADTAESKRFLDSLIDFAKLPIDFDEALVLIKESQQDRKQGRVVVPQLRLSDPAWAPWDVKTAQKRYMQREGMVENENGEIVRKKPKSMEEMVADAKAVREATAKEISVIEVEETMISDDDSPVPATDETANTSASRRGGRSESQTRRVWERHEALRREREQREQELQRAALPPLDMTDPLQALAASMFTTVNGSGSKGRGRPSGMNGRRRSGSPKQYQRREASEDMEMEESYEQPMELSD